MMGLRRFCQGLVESTRFEYFITIVIIVNSILIGVQLSTNNQTILLIQEFILGIFTFEIIIRYIATKNIKCFFFSGWNVFDLLLVLIGYIPESMFENSSSMMAIRVLRVFRVLRLLRAAPELKLIVTVLVRSLTSMFYNLILFLIFVYLYAIIGVSLFRLPDPASLSGQDKINYERMLEAAPNSPANSPDPFGDIGEAVFTLFRALTGEDWTDLRYNLLTATEYDVIKISPHIVTIYHVSWFCLSAFLLLNLVTGAVINNYQLAISQQKEERQKHLDQEEACS